jgi:hypothetical protein
MFKSRLYLDFDCVINADKPQFDTVASFDHSINRGYGLRDNYTITYAPEVVSRLSNTIINHDVELVWLSTWNDNLEVLKLPGKLDGLYAGRVLNCVLPRTPCTQREWTQWKAAALLADQKNDNTPFAWVDDEALEFHKKAVDAATSPILPKLFMEPRPWRGLTNLDLIRLENFFAAV